MKRKNRVIALAMAVILTVGLSAACAQSKTIEMHDPEVIAIASPEGVVMDLSWEMVPLTQFPAMFDVKTPTAPGTLVKKNDKAEIDYSNTADGYIMVKYLQNTTMKLKVRVAGPSGVNYDYNLKSDGTYEVFPLSDGNGKYTIGVFKQIEAGGSKYSTENAVSGITVEMKDQFAPFLRPNQMVNFKTDSEVVKKATELVKGKTEFFDKVSSIYDYVIKNFTYDQNFAAEVKQGQHSDYVPVLDDVLSRKKGICFDYAALMTAMLRSQDIPTKLVFGYTKGPNNTSVYHAWIDVYSEKDGWVGSVIQFDGKVWKLMDPTFASSSNSSKDALEHIGTGSNYSVKYIY